MKKKVRNFIREHHMVEKGECVLAAVSGGADSLCMLLILLELQQELGITLRVVHVEHGIRGQESKKDAAFVENFCSQRQIPCKVFCCDAKTYARERRMSLEEGARELRYQYLQQTAEEFGADKIALAHNQNDCAETMLFHLARGTGMKGMCGIRPVRQQIIRPLLCVARSEIEAYLAEKGQGFCRDQTNEELLYARNRIRHQVIPVLSKINANAVSHINQAAAFVTEAVELLDDLTKQSLQAYVHEKDGGTCILQELQQEKQVVRRAVIHKALQKEAGKSQDIAMIHVKQLEQLFAMQTGKKINLPYNIEGQKTYQGVLLRRQAERAHESSQVLDLEALATGSLYISSHGYQIQTRLLDKIPQNEEIPKKMYTKWLDYDKIKGNMRMRTRQKQDFLVIDAQGSRKKLKKYFVDEKVPEYQRDQVLLLADDTHILWVIGYRVSEDVKVTQHTKRILEIQVNGGTTHE